MDAGAHLALLDGGVGALFEGFGSVVAVHCLWVDYEGIVSVVARCADLEKSCSTGSGVLIDCSVREIFSQ